VPFVLLPRIGVDITIFCLVGIEVLANLYYCFKVTNFGVTFFPEFTTGGIGCFFSNSYIDKRS